MLLMAKAASKCAEDVTPVIESLLSPYKSAVKSITFDNGKEFAKHLHITNALDCDCYFAKPYHSWERGSNERTNGLIRQYMPKGVPVGSFSAVQVETFACQIINRPMALHRGVRPNTLSAQAMQPFGCICPCRNLATRYPHHSARRRELEKAGQTK